MGAPERHATRFAIACVAALTITGCPTDERTLLLAPPEAGLGNGDVDSGVTTVVDGGDAGLDAGSDADAAERESGAGNGTGGRGSGGTSSTGGAAQSGGAGGEPLPPADAGPDAPPPPLGCPDDDHDGTPDCDESVVTNPAFDSDAKGWDSEPDVLSSWNPTDAFGSKNSGALTIDNTVTFDLDGWSMSGARQCVAVEPGRDYLLLAQALVESDQGSGAGGLNVWVYEEADCNGTLVESYSTSLAGNPGGWQRVAGNLRTTSNAQSMLVRLVVTKPFRQASFKMVFDGIRVIPQ